LVLVTPLPDVAQAVDVDLLEHTPGGLVSGRWTLDVTVLGNVTSVRMKVDGTNATYLDRVSPGRYTTVLDTTALPEGDHRVAVEAFDGSGASDKEVIDVVVDNTLPEVEVRWPYGDNFTLPFPFNVTFWDEHMADARAWVEADGEGGGAFALERRPWGFLGTVDVRLLDNGTRNFTVVAVDGAGNRVVSDTRQLTTWALPDLVATNLFFRDSSPPQTQVGNYTVFFHVRNRGMVTAAPFDVALYAGDERVATTRSEGNLSVNGTWEGSLTWWARQVGTYNLTVVVDPDDAIQEMNESNNARMITRRVSPPPQFCRLAMMVVAIPAAACMLVVRRRGGPGRVPGAR